MGWAAILLFLATAFTPVTNLAARSFGIPPRIEAAGAIVVLGASLNGDGELANESMRRAIEGITLYLKGLAPLVVFSGPGPRAERATEAQIRAKLAEDLGVPREAIVILEDARTTQQESLRIANLLPKQSEKTILLVTDSLHMRRAKSVFEEIGWKVLPAPWDDPAHSTTTPAGRVSLGIRLTFETAALAYYRIAGYL
jgi:uncharacterized SAM-binding protein YcdF (DUF218 family)